MPRSSTPDGPVLVAPPATVSPSLCRRVALAWNGSAEASRVVGMALPYLAKAEAVTILSAPGTDKRAPAEALAGYLALHGIKAGVESFELHHHQSVGHALLEQAQKANADLLAMGAYGHSRLRGDDPGRGHPRCPGPGDHTGPDGALRMGASV